MLESLQFVGCGRKAVSLMSYFNLFQHDMTSCIHESLHFAGCGRKDVSLMSYLNLFQHDMTSCIHESLHFAGCGRKDVSLMSYLNLFQHDMTSCIHESLRFAGCGRKDVSLMSYLKRSRYIHPSAWLHRLCTECPEFAGFLEGCHRTCPSSLANPWRIVIYADEVVPGNPLKATNMRKVWGIYYGICETGHKCLQSEYGWHTLCILRRSRLKNLGLSVLCEKLFHAFDDLSYGQRFPGMSSLLTASLELLIADEAALKAVYENKGSSGLFPCMMCSNVVSRSSSLSAIENQLLDHTISSLEHVVPHTVESVRAIMDHLQAQKLVLNQKQFGDLERNLGFNWVPRGVLAQGSKINVTSFQFDWCHCYLVQGLFGLEAFRPMKSVFHHHVMSHRIMVFIMFIPWRTHI